MDAIDDEEYSGGLVNLLQDSVKFVARNTKKAWRKTGYGRIEMPDYPDDAILEGIVNALIHRDYLELGSEVHIDMFDDRLEIMKPEFKSGNSDFWLIFKNLNYGAKDIEDALSVNNTDKMKSHLNQIGQDVDRMIIDFCREPKSVMEIMDHFEFKSRTTFKRNYLQKMLTEGTLKMTIPDKPSSKN